MKKKLVYIIIGIISLGGVLLSYYLVNLYYFPNDIQTHINNLEEHCKTMPEMAGCEQFNLSGSVTTGAHTMDHAAMVTDEISFLSEMIPHHQEAIDTSAILLTQTQHTGLKLILVNIMSGQANEIKMMKGRLSDNYSGSDYRPMYMPMMRDTSSISAITTLEKMYMEDMIVHHQGAVDMATKLLSIMTQQDPLIRLTEEGMKQRDALKLFAQNIIDAQTKEIAQFQELLQNY